MLNVFVKGLFEARFARSRLIEAKMEKNKNKNNLANGLGWDICQTKHTQPHTNPNLLFIGTRVCKTANIHMKGVKPVCCKENSLGFFFFFLKYSLE